MTININDAYRMTSDRYGWALERLVGEKKPRWRPIGYWPTLEQLAKGYADYRLREVDTVAGMPDIGPALKSALAELHRAVEAISALDPEAA